jgi:ABC-type sugar transport system permease subunit
MNFGLIWDLYKSVRNPFENAENRTRLIYLFSPSYFLGIFVYWGIHNHFQLSTFYEKDPVCGDFRFNLMLSPGNSIIQALYNIFAFATVAIVGKALCRKGLNK